MEDYSKEKGICFDQIEKIMQELDATNKEPNSSTQPLMDLPHRPIILQPQIKEEPKDKDTDNCSPQTGVNACNNHIISEVPTKISGKHKNGYTSTEIQDTQPEVPMKIQRVEDNGEKMVEPPTEADKNDNEQAELDNRYNNSSNEQQIKNPTTIEQITQIKSEPLDTSPIVTEENSMQNKTTTVSTAENTTYKDPQEIQTEINMDSTAPNSANVPPDTDEALPDNFFDDLIKEADNITAAALKSNATNHTPQEHTEVIINVKSEPVDTDVPGVTTTETLESTATNSTAKEIEPTQVFRNVNNEPVDETTPSVPENFFDDLLVDRIAEHIDDAVNHDLEIKYSERLKELQNLESEEQGLQKAHKKHKRKKKKSRKHSACVNEDAESISGYHKRKKRRSRSHSKSPQSNSDLEEHDVHNNSKSPTMSHTKRIRIKSEFTSNRNRTMEIFDLDAERPETSASAARRMLRIKPEFSTFQPLEDLSDVCLPVTEKELFQRRSNIDRNGLIVDMTAPLSFKRIKMGSDIESTREEDFISPEDKMKNARNRAIAAIDEFNKSNKKSKDRSFIFTNTVRKLPDSSSYIKQQIYDYRSPLHNVKNVLYKFNSHANQLNLHEWGIEEMPRKATEVAKILGFDIDAIDRKRETIKLPPKIQKVKQEHMEQTKQNLIHTQPSFLATVSTQTDKVTVLDATDRDIAVQSISKVNNIGTQTTNSYGDLPLMRQIRSFNENQLLALSDFADLISESTLSADANALDLFRLRQRMMDIYKCSQLPSELRQNNHKPSEQSVRDPRQKSMNSLPTPPPPPRIQPFIRDPRQERMLTMQESVPPSWSTAHAFVRPHYHRPFAAVQQQPPPPTYHQRPAPPAAVALKIPTNGQLPVDPRQTATHKYYGRGRMRQ